MSKTILMEIFDDKPIRATELRSDDVILTKERFDELISREDRYAEHLRSLRNHTLVEDSRLVKLHEIEDEYNKIKNEYSVLKLRYMHENLIKHKGGTPVDWACFHITRFLHDYLKEHNVKDTDSITEKRMQTVAFVHCLEDKLLDYIDKLEEFNS